LEPIPSPPAAAPKGRCTICFRPDDLCFCGSIPRIDNRTEVLIVQHRREQFHAFNTARIVRRALRRCRWIADHTPRLGQLLEATPLSPRAALLYPSPEAERLAEIPVAEFPDQLVILDGTWNHAKTLVRDLPCLASLRRVRLAPSSPSRYRIRREPNQQSLSSLEATVAALRLLEPETDGLDQLVGVFEQMIDRQIDRSQTNHVPQWRQRKRRRTAVSNVPRVLAGDDLSSVVVAYGEQRRGGRGRDHAPRLPLYWMAKRLVGGQEFRCAIAPPEPLDDRFLDSLRLARDDFSQAVSLEQFRHRWNAFLRPGDQVVVYHSNTAKMLHDAGAEISPAVIMKAIQFDHPPARGTLDDVLRSIGIETVSHHGSRAAQRLAAAVALARYVNSLCTGGSFD
jgi:DTW domain-containing protein YfiP